MIGGFREKVLVGYGCKRNAECRVAATKILLNVRQVHSENSKSFLKEQSENAW